MHNLSLFILKLVPRSHFHKLFSTALAWCFLVVVIMGHGDEDRQLLFITASNLLTSHRLSYFLAFTQTTELAKAGFMCRLLVL